MSEPFTLGGTLRDDLALIDTSAAIALRDTRESLHTRATLFFEEASLDWAAVNLTAHETFTRLRYGADVKAGLGGFDFLRTGVTVIDFQMNDEIRARSILTKYADRKIRYDQSPVSSWIDVPISRWTSGLVKSTMSCSTPSTVTTTHGLVFSVTSGPCVG